MNYKLKFLGLDQLPKSSRYIYLQRQEYFLMLNVWAAWARAKLAKADCPTMTMVWGTVDFAATVWEHTRTREIRVAVEQPDSGWKRVGEHVPELRETTGNLFSSVNITGLAVQRVMKEHLSEKQRREVLNLLPISGKYQADALVKVADDGGVHLLETMTLRDLRYRSEHTFNDQPDQKAVNILAKIAQNRSICAAVAALSTNAAMMPAGFETQPRLYEATTDESLARYTKAEEKLA